MLLEPNYGLILSRGYNKIACDLVQKLLNKNPKTRLSMNVALKHPWFKLNFNISQRSADEYNREAGSKLALIKQSFMKKLRRQNSRGNLDDESHKHKNKNRLRRDLLPLKKTETSVELPQFQNSTYRAREV